MPLQLSIEGRVFKDSHGREVTLRGVNLASDSKLPSSPNLPSHVSTHFFDGDKVSFTQRPFPPEDADRHFSTLKQWGYNTIRFLFTWEAIEHRGPKLYDEEFISTTIDILKKAKSFGFFVFMDPHQDVWSRFSGGSGAPMWTLYAAGLDPRNFKVTEAALVHNLYPDPSQYPKMIWSTNYTRLVCQIMFTLFFAGRDFAPKAILDGQNIQDYLQSHFIAACCHLAKRIRDAEDLEDTLIIGWESLNEPNHGIIGYERLDLIPKDQQLQKGTSPTAWQAILTGSGRACEVETWEFGSTGCYKTGSVLVDPSGKQVWLPPDYDDSRYGWKRHEDWKLGRCIWAQHGVWDDSSDALLNPAYFSKNPRGEPIDSEFFVNTYFVNHFLEYKKAIRQIMPNTILFCQPPVWAIPPLLKDSPNHDPRLVYAPHFYDGITLMTKKWNRFWNVDVLGVLRGRYFTPALALRIGETAIRNCFRDQLLSMKKEGLDNIGDTPCLFSEIGIPFDMDDKYAYRTGDYISQIRAMDANHYALEGGLLNFTLWTYCATNNHEWGDQWNGEDLSVVSIDDNTPFASAASNPGRKVASLKSPMSLTRTLSSGSLSSGITAPQAVSVAGGRAFEATLRPSPIFTFGRLKSYGFDLSKATFSMSLESDSSTIENTPTEIFVPLYHFPKENMKVQVSGGKWLYDDAAQILRWWHMAGEQSIEVSGIRRITQGIEDDSYMDVCMSSCLVS